MAGPRCILRFSDDSDSGHHFHLDVEGFQKILDQVGPRPFTLYSMNGGKRLGKSTTLNFFLRYLYHLTREEFDQNENWLESDLPHGSTEFLCGGGSAVVTKGIHIWSHPFILSMKQATGKVIEFAVLLMDTQGLFDKNTTTLENLILFSASSFFASSMMYNFRELDESVLQHVENFADFALQMHTVFPDNNEACNRKKKMQNLTFLHRDFMYPDEYEYGLHTPSHPADEKNFMRDYIMPNPRTMAIQNLRVRRRIRSAFDTVQTFLMPNPEKKFIKCPHISNASLDYQSSMKFFVEFMLSTDQFHLKVFADEAQVSGTTCKIYLHSFAQYLNDLCANGGNQQSAPKTIADYANEARYKILVKQWTDDYVHNMNEFVKGHTFGVTSEVLKGRHVVDMKRARQGFRKDTAGGNPELVQEHKDELKQWIRNHFDELWGKNLTLQRTKKGIIGAATTAGTGALMVTAPLVFPVLATVGSTIGLGRIGITAGVLAINAAALNPDKRNNDDDDISADDDDDLVVEEANRRHTFVANDSDEDEVSGAIDFPMNVSATTGGAARGHNDDDEVTSCEHLCGQPFQVTSASGGDVGNWLPYSMALEKSMEVGDLIEFNRMWYSHWGIYYGNNRVVHFNPLDGAEVDITQRFSNFVPASVTTSPLNEVAGICRIRINNNREPKSSGPNKMKRRPLEKMLQIIQGVLEKANYYYSLVYFNCEHFATFVKFEGGSCCSSQILKFSGLLKLFTKKEEAELVLLNELAQRQWEENERKSSQNLHPTFFLEKEIQKLEETGVQDGPVSMSSNVRCFEEVLQCKIMFPSEYFASMQRNVSPPSSLDDSLKELRNQLDDPEFLRNAYSHFLSFYQMERSGLKLTVGSEMEFKENVLKIAKHNLEAAQGRHSWFSGLTPFTDMSQEEFESLCPLSDCGTSKWCTVDADNLETEEAVSVPGWPTATNETWDWEDVDWVKKGHVGPVRHQCNCGCCYAFATADALACNHSIKHGGHVLRLSAQEVVDCSNNDGCDGGYPSRALDYMKAWGGVRRKLSVRGI